MLMTDKDVTIYGHGSGTPSKKNLYTYSASRYSQKASNGKRKGIVEVRRLIDLDDAHRDQFVTAYKTILGRNKYNQSKRSYVYTKHSDGHYYSDCSSSIMATFRKIGYNVELLNTAGIHWSPKFFTVKVNIENGHIKSPEVLKVGDCILFRGSDPSRPLQIGHVEVVAAVPTLVSGHGSIAKVAKGGEKVTVELTTLCKGISGCKSEVKTAQRLLIASGYSCGSYKDDGDFGKDTETADKAFQKAKSLPVTGIVDKATWSKLLGV